MFSVAAISMEGAAGVGLGAGDGSELGELSPPQALSKNADANNTINNSNFFMVVYLMVPPSAMR